MSENLSGLGSFPIHLEFRPKPTAFVVRGRGKEAAESAIEFTLAFPRLQKIETPGGRSLRDVEWTLSVHEGSFHRGPGHDDVNGLLTYSPEHDDYPYFPESAGADFYLAPPVFAGLSRALLAGLVPTEITLSARGLRLGTGSDDYIWDIEANATLPLVDLKISFALDDEGGGAEPSAHPLRDDLRELRDSLALHATKLTRSVSTALTWILCALVGILLTLWFT